MCVNIHTYIHTLRARCVRAYAKIRNYFLTALFQEKEQEEEKEEEDDKQKQKQQQKLTTAAKCVCVCASVLRTHIPNKYNEYKF